MKGTDYIRTVVVKDKVINIGMDDYGQCYYAEWVDEDGKVGTLGCGAYNFGYLEEIYGFFDEKGTYISLYGEDEWNERVKRIEELRDSRGKDDKELYDHYQEMIDRMQSSDYEIYNFKEMYGE